jgi:hypothetical protein
MTRAFKTPRLLRHDLLAYRTTRWAGTVPNIFTFGQVINRKEMGAMGVPVRIKDRSGALRCHAAAYGSTGKTMVGHVSFDPLFSPHL